MAILSRELLNPVRFAVQDPFFSVIREMERWLQQHYPTYYSVEWPTLRYKYLQRILGLTKNGASIRGYAQRAPSEELTSALLEIYSLLDHSVYFTSKYWRAFFFWLKTSNLNLSYWPQFGEREVYLALSLLTEDDMNVLKLKANQEWLDFFTDTKVVTDLFKKLEKPIKNLCIKRVEFLSQYDPAMFSIQDVCQHTFEKILISLRKNDYITNHSTKMVGWALKCADNAIHNLRDSALAKRRNIDVKNPKIITDGSYINPKLSTDLADDPEECIIDLIGTDTFERTVEDDICLQTLLEHANPKINCYLRTICKGEHNSDFWTWFYYHEPALAQRPAYLAENPEAIGPYLQRHLNLSTYQLTNFLRQHLPTLLEKVSNTPSNLKKLAYVVGGN